VERTAADDMAVAGLPSTSGAHWANRDNETLYRQSGSGSTPFRRPPALNSFQDGDVDEHQAPGEEDLSASAYPPAEVSDVPATSWFADPAAGTDSRVEPEPYTRSPAEAEPITHEPIAPEFGPAPPATPGRVSFGVSAGPISPIHRSGAEPTSPAPAFHEFLEGEHEIRPHRATRGQDHTPPRGLPGVAEEPRRRSPAMVVSTMLLSTLVLLGAAVAGVAYFSGSDKSLPSVLKLGAGQDDERTATAPLDGRTSAQFELVAATSKATIRTADLGGDLYKITAPDNSGVKPSPVLSEDRVQLHLTPAGRGANSNVDVVLSSKVRWALRFTGGADEQIVDLTTGQVSALDVLGGIRRFQLKLPKPSGTVPVRVTGAIEDFSIQSPVGNPVRVRVDSGAKTVAAGQVTLKDVKPGSTLTPKDWKVTNRYDVDAAARVTLLSVGNAG
jgi:hypothetical protein